jgi:hypothetical protein
MSSNQSCFDLARMRDGEPMRPGEEKDVLADAIKTIVLLETENQNLSRKHEDLRMFCTGIARNIGTMLG